MNGQTSPTNPPGVAIHHHRQATQGVRMAGSASTGQGLPRDIRGVGRAYDWPGREFGIRKPYPAETPLNWHEVNHFLNKGAMQ